MINVIVIHNQEFFHNDYMAAAFANDLGIGEMGIL